MNRQIALQLDTLEKTSSEPRWRRQEPDQETHRLLEECQRLREQINWRTSERDRVLHSVEYRLGDLLLNRLHLRAPLEAVWWRWVAFWHRLVIVRLALEKYGIVGHRCRVMTTVCANFPIYSQTFVYQELTQLGRQEFDVRLVYSALHTRDNLHAPFRSLWGVRRRLLLHRKVHESDFKRYQSRMPDKVETLIQKICHTSGLARQELLSHDNFLQAFSFTRMVEAYRPHYLHSYFFYDRSLMALVAGYLLEIPRGVSCYTDHLLHDYELKVVPLHMELCDVIIATSARIKNELLEMAPGTNPDRILVKPNAIDTAYFPLHERREPPVYDGFRLLSVCRIEPKKGLLYLIEAIALLRQRGLRIDLHIVGSTDEWSQASRDYKRQLDQRISELDLWGTIHLEGQQNAEGVRRFLNLAHLFVAPFVETVSGDKDGIPTALLEAMAAGVPVVATDAGSIPEVIANGRDGVLVPQRDPVALADAIKGLLRRPSQRLRMGLEAANTVRQRFDVRVCEQRFHDRIRVILSPAPKNGYSDSHMYRR